VCVCLSAVASAEIWQGGKKRTEEAGTMPHKVC